MHVAILQLTPMICVALLARPGRAVIAGRLLQGLLFAALLSLITATFAADLRRVVVPISFVIGSLAMVVFLRRLTEYRWITALGGAGCFLNVLPITVYGAMPVRTSARQAIHSEMLPEPAVVAVKHVEVSNGDLLTWLGDTIPVAPLQAVVSIGDVLLYITFAAIAVSAMAERLAEAKKKTHGWVFFDQFGLRHA